MAVEDAADLACFFDEDEFGLAALFTPVSGPAIAIVVIRDAPDVRMAFGDADIIAASNVFMIRADQVADPTGGQLLIGTDRFRITGAPKIDTFRTVWSCEAEPF